MIIVARGCTYKPNSTPANEASTQGEDDGSDVDNGSDRRV